MLVKDLMTASVSSLLPDAPASDAVKIMKGENVGMVPVCDLQRRVLGVITDRDVVLRGYEGKQASEIMTSPAITVSSGSDVHDAALKMSESGIRRLVVTENEKLAGVLSLKDLAKKRIFIAEIGHIIYDICNRKPQS